MRPSWHFIIVSLFFAAQVQAQQEPPMSAIDWLSESVEDIELEAADIAPVSRGVLTPNVTVTLLDGPENLQIGISPIGRPDFPPNIWSNSPTETLTRQLAAISGPQLPAMRELLVNLLIAEALPPLQQTHEHEFLLARIDKLLDLGDLEHALELLEVAGPQEQKLFRRYFDVSLLTGTEHRACDLMTSRPSIAPTYPARIFCLARSGDWPAAALTLNTHKALGDISDEEDLLLSLFLDPEVAELNVNLPNPSRVSPLVFRIREAIGENLTTTQLPLAFSHADLRDIVGWKAQLEAAERLARASAIDPSLLHQLYTSRRPSASGGVWDRVAAVQKLESALEANDVEAISNWLEIGWDLFADIDAEYVFAALFKDAVQNLELAGKASSIETKVKILIDPLNFLTRAETPFSAEALERLITSIDASNRHEEIVAVALGMESDNSSLQVDMSLSAERIGLSTLEAIRLAQEGMNGNLHSMSQSLTTLRELGLDEAARKAALEFLILDRQS